jgi:hypothetical protein
MTQRTRHHGNSTLFPSPSRRPPLHLAVAFALSLGLGAGVVLAQTTSIQPEALRQIGVLTAEKLSRTPAERKVASRLLYELDRRRGAAFLDSLPDLRSGVAVADDGTVLIDVDAAVDDALVARVGELGGRVVSAFPRFDALRAHLPLDAVVTLAAAPAVRSIRPADAMMVQGANVTEGDVAHGSDQVRTDFGIDGTGVQAGAMSDSVEALAALQASGDLPAGVTVLPGQAGSGTSEGTALMEIVHDMAPGADLFFATGQGGQAQMAQNILDLQAAGCDVIVDDVLYFAEPVFQDGVIAQAVDTVAAAGTIYFSSAGNSGNLNAGTAGVFEGDYSGIALPAVLTGAGTSAHDFGGGDASNQVTVDTPFFFTLQWADPQDASSNDYDLYLLDSTLSTVLDASTNVQDGTQDPFEILDSTVDDDTDNRLVVVKFSGADRFIHLNSHRGQLGVATDGQIFGHPAAVGALAVAAVNVATAMGGQFTGGAGNPVEVFTSDGPRRIFFDADGTPVSAPEGRGPTSVVRQKPDVAAADGVMTATPGFNPFFGTSASAPHGAGIAALFDDLFPGVSVPSAQDIFRSSALDIEAPGFDRDSGAGIIMAEPPLGQPIFVDGFESGDVSAWTDSTP